MAMRLDAHQHFWRYNPREHVWMTAAMDALRRDFLPDDLEPLLQQAEVDGTIAVQARQNVRETAWLLSVADATSFVKGVVGWVDLRSPRAEEQLEFYGRHAALRGIRHVVHDEPDDQFIVGPDFLRGLGLLGEFNLTYDLLLFPRHLPYACEVAERFPHQTFILDHIAKPPINDRTLTPWDRDIERLAAYPNVYCKVSGLVTEAAWGRWTPQDFAPYLDCVFACFGPRRVMFGSDWPVCTLSADYTTVRRLVTDYIQRFLPEVREDILGHTAARCYGIPSDNGLP